MYRRNSFVAVGAACAAVAFLAFATARAAEEKGRKASEKDMAFIMQAGEGGDAEVAMGKLAEANAANAEVKAFGKRMVEDHTKANEKLIKLAKGRDIQLSHELKGETKEMYDRLAKLSGAEFDKHYMSHMVKDHQEDAEEFSKEAKEGDDPKLRDFASDTLKVIQQHLALAKAIAPKVGAESAALDIK